MKKASRFNDNSKNWSAWRTEERITVITATRMFYRQNVIHLTANTISVILNVGPWQSACFLFRSHDYDRQILLWFSYAPKLTFVSFLPIFESLFDSTWLWRNLSYLHYQLIEFKFDTDGNDSLFIILRQGWYSKNNYFIKYKHNY